MALTNYNRRCTSCGGNKWEYLKELKLWRCRYCDAQVERQEQYDGLYTIKNVVRQVILDSAYRRMEQADRNLSECQKINARYTGTLVAGICCRMIAAVSGIGLAGQEPRALLGQIRRDYMQLTEESEDLGDDETALYEFLDSSDAWAVLAMVFDTLGDEQRCNYLLTLTEPNQVFSKETNKSLLRYAVKHKRMELAEQILANRENVDITDALKVILESCPDGAPKARMAAALIADGAVSPDDLSALEGYLEGTDSAATKAAVACAACKAGLQLRVELVIRQVLSGAELPEFEQVLGALFQRRLYDGEIEQLLGFAEALEDAPRSMAVINAIADSGQFVSLSARQAQAFICAVSTAVEHRVQLLSKLRSFSSGSKMWESVTGAYLCQAEEPPEARTTMLDALCTDLGSIPAKDFEQYVLLCTADGEVKSERIRKLLELPNMNVGFFRELAGKYIRGNKDDPAYQSKILWQLLECGLTIDSSVLIDYVCNGDGTADDKVELVQLAVKSGTPLRADALSIYLERCAGNFEPQLFALLYRDGAKISQKALENYVLCCEDFPAVKVRNALALAKNIGVPLGSSGCRIHYQGSGLSCSLAQAYILLTKEDVGLASAMVRSMTDAGVKLAAPVEVDGVSKKFSKFVQEKRSQLTPVAESLCQENRLFSRFF